MKENRLLQLQQELETLRAENARLVAMQSRLQQSEEALRQSEARLRQIIDLVPVYIYAKNREGRFLLVNRVTAQGFGREPHEVEGRTQLELTPVEAEAQDYLKDDREVMDSGQPKTIPEETFTDTQGRVHYLHTIKIPFTTSGTGEPAVLGVSVDITDYKRLEQQLLHSQKMGGIGRLAGGIAHDFNNFLTAILGYTELAETHLAPDSPLHTHLQHVRRAADRAANLTRQLLAFARKQIIAPQVIHLNDLIGEMDRLLRRIIGEDIELVTIMDDALWPVKVDPGQIEQVIVNLAVNARDAMPRGGKLTIETTNIVLDRDYARTHAEVLPGEYVMVAVSDTGVGMDESVQQHIFEPFFTTKEPGKGTGLGLATCLGIVKQHGGHIWLYSEPGHGTTFKIYLPRALETTMVLSHRETPAVVHGTETVLIVEDEPLVRDIAARVLQEHGYDVHVAANGIEALRFAAQFAGEIHLLVTDVVMPQMSGKEVAERLAAERPDLKVLYTSGYTDNAIVHHGVLDADVAFLQKPYTPLALTRKVREVLDTE